MAEKIGKFEVMFTSPPDRERLVAEIWFENRQVAEICKDKRPTTIELYGNKGEPWKFELKDFVAALKAADEGITDP